MFFLHSSFSPIHSAFDFYFIRLYLSILSKISTSLYFQFINAFESLIFPVGIKICVFLQTFFLFTHFYLNTHFRFQKKIPAILMILNFFSHVSSAFHFLQSVCLTNIFFFQFPLATFMILYNQFIIFLLKPFISKLLTICSMQIFPGKEKVKVFKTFTPVKYKYTNEK